MDHRSAAAEFLRRHHMHPDDIDTGDFCLKFEEIGGVSWTGTPKMDGINGINCGS